MREDVNAGFTDREVSAMQAAARSQPESDATRVVLARKSYDHLIRTRDRALREAEYARERVADVSLWAHRAFDEQRRLQDRLTAVATAAASLGVPISAINEALGTTYPPVSDAPVEYHERVYVHPSGERRSYLCCCPVGKPHEVPVNDVWLTEEEVDDAD